jgi:SulP family sulfate permease
MACLAGVLVVVSYNMFGFHSFIGLSKAPKSDFIVMLVTFVLTIVFDLTIAIEMGLLLAVILFLKRTNESTVIRAFSDEIDPSLQTDLRLHGDDLEMLHIPPFTEVYEIDGPYFFGIANKFDEISQRIGTENQKVRILRMRKVSFIDSTGLHNLEQLYQRSSRCGLTLVLSGVNEQVFHALEKAGLVEMIGRKNIRDHINGALARAEELVKESQAQ